jgi:hypothetical protein
LPPQAQGQVSTTEGVFTLVKMSPRSTFTVAEANHVIANIVNQDPQTAEV